MPAEETVSMQLFSQRPHLVEFTAKQEVEVSSAHWYGRNGTARIIVGELVELRKRVRNGGLNVDINCGNYTTIKGPASVFHR